MGMKYPIRCNLLKPCLLLPALSRSISHLLLQHCEILGVVLDDVVLRLGEVSEVGGEEDHREGM